jgi:hypothetical protein
MHIEKETLQTIMKYFVTTVWKVYNIKLYSVRGKQGDMNVITHW